jgi:hypothetical protein
MRSAKAWRLLAEVATMALIAWFVWSSRPDERVWTPDTTFRRPLDPAPSDVRARDGGREVGRDSDSRHAAGEHDGAGSPVVRDAESPAPSASEPTPSDSVRAIGRVVDDRRQPVIGASVLLRRPAQDDAAQTTGQAGRFEFSLARPRFERREVLFAFVVDGNRVGIAETSFVEKDGPLAADPVDFGAIVVRDGGALHVRALASDDKPVADAVVQAQLGETWRLGPRATTDAAGLATFAALPIGPVRLVATALDGSAGTGIARIDASAPNEAMVRLAPTRDVDVVVRDLEGQPIEGALVAVVERRLVDDQGVVGFVGRSEGGLAFEPTPSPTDEQGRTRVRGLRPDLGGWITASKEGFESSHERSRPTSIALPTEIAPIQLALQRPSPRVLRWHVRPGAAPVPPDGSVIRLQKVSRSEFPGTIPPPSQGRMEGGDLVVDSIVFGSPLTAWAVAPDDSIAYVSDPNYSRGESTIEFAPSRSLTVVLRDEGGRPLAGWLVAASVDPRPRNRFEGNDLLERTDADGRATFRRLAPQHRVVRALYDDRSSSIQVGDADLESGDVTLEATVPARFETILSIRIDGEPRLPASYELSAWGGVARAATEEDPDRGELHVFFQRDAHPVARTLLLQAAGFVTARVPIVEPPPDAPPAVIAVEMQHGATLLARVIPGPDHVPRPHLERFDPTRGAFRKAADLPEWIQSPNSGVDGYEFTGLAPGRYQLAEGFQRQTINGNSYVASEPVELVAGGSATVTLDLSRLRPVNVRVLVPDGEPAYLARLLVLDRGTQVALEPNPDYPTFPGLELSEAHDVGVWVEEGGSLRVRAWHPWLVPSPDGGEREVHAGDHDVELRLERGVELRFPAPPNDDRYPANVTVELHREGDLATPVGTFFTADVGGTCRCAPLPVGTFNVLLDCNAFTPVVRHAVVFDGSPIDLGEIAWDHGSVLRVVSKDAEVGATANGFQLVMRHCGLPSYRRRSYPWRNDGLPIALGLGAGEFDVEVLRTTDWSTCFSTRITLDGTSAVELPVDLR